MHSRSNSTATDRQHMSVGATYVEWVGGKVLRYMVYSYIIVNARGIVIYERIQRGTRPVGRNAS